MKIKNGSNPDTIKKISFYRTLFTGRKIEQWIEASHSPFDDEGPSLNISSVNLQLQDVEEFIEAIRLAAMIASGKLEVR